MHCACVYRHACTLACACVYVGWVDVMHTVLRGVFVVTWVEFSSVQDGSMHLQKPILCAPPYHSEVSPMLPLKQWSLVVWLLCGGLFCAPCKGICHIHVYIDRYMHRARCTKSGHYHYFVPYTQ